MSYDGSGPSISWNDISPRVSATFALDAARKTIARASFARYAGQLNPGQVTLASPVGSYYSYIAYKWNDLNGDHLAQKNEVLTNLAPVYWGSGIDIRNPGSAQPPPQGIASNYTANHDNEFIIGFDRELMPNFGFNLSYTYHTQLRHSGLEPQDRVYERGLHRRRRRRRPSATPRSCTHRTPRRSTPPTAPARSGTGRITTPPTPESRRA